MRVISVSETGDLLWTEAADLVPSPAEILIDVKATAINRADLMQRKGLYPPPPGTARREGRQRAHRNRPNGPYQGHLVRW